MLFLESPPQITTLSTKFMREGRWHTSAWFYNHKHNNHTEGSCRYKMNCGHPIWWLFIGEMTYTGPREAGGGRRQPPADSTQPPPARGPPMTQTCNTQLSSVPNICFNSTHRTSISQSTHSQELCEGFGHDLQVLLVKLEQILHLKVDCSYFSPVWDRGSLPHLYESFVKS